MSSLINPLRSIFQPIKPIPAGIYHYISPPDDPRNYRLHLRVEPDGYGVLIVNASTILHLNQSATEYAFYITQNLPIKEGARQMAKRFQVDEGQARQDYQEFVDQIQTLVNTPDLDPVSYLGMDRHTPFSKRISAPYRMDIALTYRLPQQGHILDAPFRTPEGELSTAEWRSTIDKIHQSGIPHVVFTGGEPMLRYDLAELIAHAEKNDMVTGLLSGGLRLADSAYLDRLLQTGLDHLMIVLEVENPDSWNALNNCIGADLFVAVHLTITEENQSQIPNLLDRLASVGVRAVSLSIEQPDLQSALDNIRQQVAEMNLELIWNLPVPYSALNPVNLEIRQEEYKRGAGRAWLYTGPNGDVFPAQGIQHRLGNILDDAWENIWKP